MKRHANRESGAALIVAMLLMLVFTIMLIGFYFMTSGEQKVAWSSRDNGVTYYWAVAGLEQMSNLIADYFSHTATPHPRRSPTGYPPPPTSRPIPPPSRPPAFPWSPAPTRSTVRRRPRRQANNATYDLMTLSLCSGVQLAGILHRNHRRQRPARRPRRPRRPLQAHRRGRWPQQYGSQTGPDGAGSRRAHFRVWHLLRQRPLLSRRSRLLLWGAACIRMAICIWQKTATVRCYWTTTSPPPKGIIRTQLSNGYADSERRRLQLHR